MLIVGHIKRSYSKKAVYAINGEENHEIRQEIRYETKM